MSCVQPSSDAKHQVLKISILLNIMFKKRSLVISHQVCGCMHSIRQANPFPLHFYLVRLLKPTDVWCHQQGAVWYVSSNKWTGDVTWCGDGAYIIWQLRRAITCCHNILLPARPNMQQEPQGKTWTKACSPATDAVGLIGARQGREQKLQWCHERCMGGGGLWGHACPYPTPACAHPCVPLECIHYQQRHSWHNVTKKETVPHC